MNDIEKSDNVVVPMKLTNKGANPLAESVEERTLTKGNTHQTTAVRIQCRVTASSGLVGVRKEFIVLTPITQGSSPVR